jgi:hypothetical protein
MEAAHARIDGGASASILPVSDPLGTFFWGACGAVGPVGQSPPHLHPYLLVCSRSPCLYSLASSISLLAARHGTNHGSTGAAKWAVSEVGA